MTPPAVHFRGVVLGPSGFAAQGREWLSLLDAKGWQPSLEGARLGPFDGGESAAERELVARCASRPRREGAVTVHHLLPPHFEPDPTASADVLITVFETERLPFAWASSVARAGAVVVPTAHGVRSFARGGVPFERLHCLPPPVATARFAARAAPHPLLPPRRPRTVRFLSVFDWSLRKGFDVLLPAFARAFPAGEADLVVKLAPCDAAKLAAIRARCTELLAPFARTAAPANVHLLAASLGADELPALYAGCDAFVLASRGEGWGRPVHEAMLAELPVVASCGHALATLLPDARHGYPVGGRVVPVPDAAVAETPAFAEQDWFEPDPDSLVRALRAVAAEPSAAAARGRAAREHVLRLCDHERIARGFAALLQSLSVRRTADPRPAQTPEAALPRPAQRAGAVPTTRP